MRNALLLLGTVAALFIGGILFESGAQYRTMLAYISPRGYKSVQPTFQVGPSLRHVVVLLAAVILGTEIRAGSVPYWANVLLCCAFVVWMALLMWHVGKEIVKRRTKVEADPGEVA
jgi:hypothetical protein